MANIFDPDKYFSTGEWKVTANSASSHYEKLGFRSGDTLSDKQIIEAFHLREDWWSQKDKIARRGQAHPVIKEVGPFIQDAIKNLLEAKSILSDPAKKAQYDKKLKDGLVKKAEEDLVKFIHFALQGDNQISEEEKDNLLNMADTLKIGRDRGEKIILDEMKKSGATFKPESDSGNTTSSSIPFDILLGQNYYEMLGLPEDADYAQIKEVYEREYKKYNTTRDKAKAEARWIPISKAWECLSDPVKRREYDEQLKQPKTPPPTGKPRLIVECKTDYTFRDIRRGVVINVDKIVIKNPEGGLLQGKIKSDVPWLEPDRNKILEKHEQELYVNILTSKIPPKTYRVEGNITIETNGGRLAIPFTVFLESYEIELQRFRKGLTIGGLILGGLFGFLIYNLNFIQGMGANVAGIAGIAALLITVIATGKLASKESASFIFGFGCGTLIIGFIVFSVLEKYFPHALSTVAWSLVYGSLANISSAPIRKALWRKNRVVPIAIGTVAVLLAALILFIGFTITKNELESRLAREKSVESSIATVASKLPGEWHGKIGKKEARFSIDKAGNQLSGKVVYEGVEEKLAVELKNYKGDIIIILKGTSYKRLNGEPRGNFSLDTFYGELSIFGRSITGDYVDTAGNKGKWSVSKATETSSEKSTSAPEGYDMKDDRGVPTPVPDPTSHVNSPESTRQKEQSNFNITINSIPTRAVVYIDKKQVGETPLSLAIAKGHHGLRVEKDGYKTKWEIIELKSDEVKEFNFILEQQ